MTDKPLPTRAETMSAADAFALVSSAPHPTPENGGPCATCAFRPESEAARTEPTRVLATLCIGGLDPFYCHEQTQICRGWIAAVNLRGVPENRAEIDAARLMADVLNTATEVYRRALVASGPDEARQRAGEEGGPGYEPLSEWDRNHG